MSAGEPTRPVRQLVLELSRVAQESSSIESRASLLHALLDLLDRPEQPAAAAESPEALLKYFESLRGSGDVERLRSLMGALLEQRKQGSPSAKFLNECLQAQALLLEQAYKGVIRTVSGSYRSDGSILRCPRCGSREVGEGMVAYEFQEMICAR